MVKYLTNINSYIVTFDTNGTLGAPGIKTSTIEHATHGVGSVGEVITSDGNGGWSWSTPSLTQNVLAINDLSDSSHTGTNYFIGELGGQNVSSAANVTAYGYHAGKSITTGLNNTLTGTYSGQNLSSGLNNTLIGTSSGSSLTTQQNNIFIGRESARQATSQYSLYIGVAAGFSSSSTHNIGIGQGAAYDNDGQYNVIIGPPANGHVDTFTCHRATSSFSGNVVIGESAMQRTNIVPARNGQSTWTGQHNVVIGKWATLRQTISSNAIAIGYQAFADSNQIVIGNTANTELYLPGLQSSANSGDVLTFDGTKLTLSTPSGGGAAEINDLTDGIALNQSIFLGINSGINVTSGLNNVAIGHEALNSVTNTSNNTAIGFRSLLNNTGHRNTAIGHRSLNDNTSGADNCGLGYNSVYNNTTGSSNCGFGYYALFQNETGDENVAMGYQALIYNGNISQSIGIGAYSGGSDGLNPSNNHTRCIFIGYSAVPNTNTTTNEIVIGSNAVGNGSNTITLGDTNITELYIPGLHSAASSGDVLTFDGTKLTLSTPSGGGAAEINDLTDGKTIQTSHYIGNSAGLNDTTGGNHVAFGYDALQQNNDYNCVAIGYSAAKSSTGGANIAIGADSLRYATGTYNICMGINALDAINNTGSFNLAIGNLANTNNSSGQKNVCLGNYSLQSNTTGVNNACVGHNSGRFNITGNNNVAVGTESLMTNEDGQYNVALGMNALRNGVSSSYNIAIGYNALANNISEDTICIGSNSVSDPLYTEIGAGIYIGNEITPSANFVENEIVIGHLGVGNGNNTITLGTQDHTELYLPGLHLGASSGDVLTFDGTKINLSTLPANSGTVVEPFAVSSIGGLFTMTSLTGYYTMFHTYIDVEFSRISLYTMSDTSAASGTIVAGVFSNLSFAPNTSLSQATYSFSNVAGVTEIIIDFSTVQLSPHNKYWLGISVQTTAGTLYLAKSALASTDNYFALSENNTFNGTTLSAPVSPNPSSFNFYYRLHRPNAPGGILSNSTTVPTAIEVAHAVHKNDTSTQNITSQTVYTKMVFDTTGHYSHSNFTLDTTNSNITVLTDGLFSVSFTGTTRLSTGITTRTTGSVALFINNIELYKSRVHTYNRIDQESDSSASYTHIGYYTAGTIFDIRVKIDNGSGPLVVKGNGNHLTVMKLSN